MYLYCTYARFPPLQALNKFIEREINPFVNEWEKAREFPAHEVRTCPHPSTHAPTCTLEQRPVDHDDDSCSVLHHAALVDAGSILVFRCVVTLVDAL